jgi:hypothetical protein
MAKVASRSWVEAARPAAALAGELPLHAHYITADNRRRIESAFAAPEPQQTIANMLLPRNLLRVGASTDSAVTALRARGEKVRVITGMRDPVARSISLLLFMADFYGHVSKPLNPRAAMDPDYLIEALRDLWEGVLNNSEPRDTFAWLAWFLTGAYRNWFDDELKASFAVDIFDTPFPRFGGAQIMGNSGAQLFVYRVEDMALDAPAHAMLIESARDFLGTPMNCLPSVNTGATRRSRGLSAEVAGRFSLPARWLDEIYAQRAVRHFYDSGEIQAFKRRWSPRAQPGERKAGGDSQDASRMER